MKNLHILAVLLLLCSHLDVVSSQNGVMSNEELKIDAETKKALIEDFYSRNFHYFDWIDDSEEGLIKLGLTNGGIRYYAILFDRMKNRHIFVKANIEK